jgi:hypothetical protein
MNNIKVGATEEPKNDHTFNFNHVFTHYYIIGYNINL